METPVRLTEGGAVAEVYPERGGWLVRYARPVGRHGLVEVLQASEPVVARWPVNMWAGNPVLFPHVSFNRVGGEEHRYEYGGRVWPTSQHGFARRTPWRVAAVSDDSLTMELTDTEATRASYPWSFQHRLEYRLRGGRLEWAQRVENRSSTEMPLSVGFHPYINTPLVPGGSRARMHLRLPAATRYTPAEDWSRFERSPFAERRLGLETDMSGTIFLGDLSEPEAAVVDEAAGIEAVIHFSGAPGYRFLALWSRSTTEGWHCVEPWSALPNSFSRPDGEVFRLPPGGVYEASLWMDAREIA